MEVATIPDASAELASLQSEAAELAQGFKDDISPDEIALPLIKLAQALTDEVQQGKAKAGEFINSITGKSYGNELEFVVVDRFKGYFFSKKGSPKGWAARADQDVVPDSWPEEYAGKRFSDLDDIEPNFKALVNAGAREWESGPPISSTHNYIGFVKGEPQVPVRVSLMRTSAPAAISINTLLKLQQAQWDCYIKLGVEENVNSSGQKSHKVTASEGEPTDDAAKVEAIRMAVAIKNAKSVALVGDEEADAQVVTPEAGKGAIDLD